VNSANVGSYGDAITQELYPYVEKTFRAVGQPSARVVYGGSTGGWEALAQQVYHPDYFNGAWVALRFELVLGTKGRSAEQYDIWQAVYSPVGEDGYPKPILGPRTGAIDRKVAEYWKEHYDLDYIMQRDWKTLGPKLIGKLHFAVGDLDNFYLDRAVRLAEKFLESTKEPGKGPPTAARSSMARARDTDFRAALPDPNRPAPCTSASCP